LKIDAGSPILFLNLNRNNLLLAPPIVGGQVERGSPLSHELSSRPHFLGMRLT